MRSPRAAAIGPLDTAEVAPPTPGGPPDLYVVVDELDELGCRLAVDPWPGVDADGRLVFDDDTVLVSVSPATFHAALTAARQRSGEVAADRPLRIGDVVAVWWGPVARELGLPRPASWSARPEAADRLAPPETELLDVTADARAAASAAAQAAAADVLRPTDLAELGLVEPRDGREGGEGPP